MLNNMLTGLHVYIIPVYLLVYDYSNAVQFDKNVA